MWNHAVWDAAQQNGIVHLMPLDEANTDQEFYAIMSGMSEQSNDEWKAINAAHTFDLLDSDPTHLSPKQLDDVIQLTLIALRKDIVFGDSFGLYAHNFPNHPHTITWDTVSNLDPSSYERDPSGMAVAHQLTSDRLKAANSGTNGTTIAPRALQ